MIAAAQKGEMASFWCADGVLAKEAKTIAKIVCPGRIDATNYRLVLYFLSNGPVQPRSVRSAMARLGSLPVVMLDKARVRCSLFVVRCLTRRT